MPRYAILTHDHPFPHWDLLLERGESLQTWRLLEEPAAGRTTAAEALPDHRRLYLDYEGPISGGRGTVRRWDGGEYEAAETHSAARFVVRLHGERLRGTAVLERCGQGPGWTLRLE